jgi:quinol monooxygenase YgiN
MRFRVLVLAALAALLTAASSAQRAPTDTGDTDARGVLVELKSALPPMRAGPGCLAYDLYHSPSAPHEFMRYEGWTTQILTWNRVAEDAPAATIERLKPRLDALIARDAVVSAVADGSEWAEGPLWNSSAGELLFFGVPRKAILEAASYRGTAA